MPISGDCFDPASSRRPVTVSLFQPLFTVAFFFRRAYPVQPSEKPEDIDEWLLSVLRKFGSDALELKESHGTGRDFPKERGILQNEFYRCAFESIPPSVTLAVETSQLTWSSVKIKGSLDFWVDSNLCWAIELMRLGTSTTIQEHENRFDEESGKYSPLEPTVARVVDFRKPGDVPQTGSDIYVAVVFHEGYFGADVYFYEKNKVNRKETVKFGVWRSPPVPSKSLRDAKSVEASRMEDEEGDEDE